MWFFVQIKITCEHGQSRCNKLIYFFGTGIAISIIMYYPNLRTASYNYLKKNYSNTDVVSNW